MSQANKLISVSFLIKVTPMSKLCGILLAASKANILEMSIGFM